MASNKILARRSQLLTTYGVGSLYPAQNASYLVAGLHLWDEHKLPPVAEPRLARQLGVTSLLSPPATPDDKKYPGVPVTRFPRVLQCPSCHAIGTVRQLRASNDDPQCGLCEDKGTLMPSRFVATCSNGHLTDFPYFDWVHGRETRPPEGWDGEYPQGRPDKAPATAHVLRLVTRGRTSSLGDLHVECSCRKSRNLERAFSDTEMKRFKCFGKRPWLGSDHKEPGCEEHLRTVQRGASNVWFAASGSAISIPPYSGRLNEIVSKELSLLRSLSRESVETSTRTGTGETLGAVAAKYGGDVDIRALARQVLDICFADGRTALSEEEFRFEEYKALLEGSADESDSQFVCRRENVPPAASTWLHAVGRVTRLREVRALRGFTRLQAAEQRQDDAISPLRPDDDAGSWLPAVEMLGEGLFLALDRSRLETWSRTQLAQDRQKALQRNAAAAAAARNAGRPTTEWIEPRTVDIVRVAVHTLAHVLIDQLALDAGYPASSLRERLFVGTDMAGILVYTASSDSAGSLGGVASMADPERLSVALSEAEDRLAWCAADPVCIESDGSGTEGSNLAACHNCVLLPETSCEEFNTGLDRGVLLGTPEDPHGGLIQWLRAHPESAPAVAETAAEEDEQSPEAIHRFGWEYVWNEMVDLRPVIEPLAEQDAPKPTADEEVGDAALVMELSWPEHWLAIGLDVDPGVAETLESEGWTVLSYSVAEGPETVVDEALGILI